jgi:hypothetical protein
VIRPEVAEARGDEPDTVSAVRSSAAATAQ